VASVHNLVTLSRFPIAHQREVRHQYVGPLQYREVTGSEPDTAAHPVLFDRPLLLAEIELPGGRHLDVINLHLRAPRASVIPGEKVDSATWSTTSGWAEGYFVSSLKRTGQALELRLLIDDILSREPERLIAVAGDFNAEDDETPVRLVRAGVDDTGNARLARRSLVVLDGAIPAGRRWSVVHHQRMLDHILASRALCERLRHVDVLNEELAAEVRAAGEDDALATSSHAPVLADFDL
jgi:endonuclease/exonuclease/phosphatase family metal-dependent hydrolase